MAISTPKDQNPNPSIPEDEVEPKENGNDDDNGAQDLEDELRTISMLGC